MQKKKKSYVGGGGLDLPLFSDIMKRKNGEEK
jgi:hypothetical protein